jgi:hypothetical protein
MFIINVYVAFSNFQSKLLYLRQTIQIILVDVD